MYSWEQTGLPSSLRFKKPDNYMKELMACNFGVKVDNLKNRSNIVLTENFKQIHTNESEIQMNHFRGLL